MSLAPAHMGDLPSATAADGTAFKFGSGTAGARREAFGAVMRLLILENQRLRKTFRPNGETVSIGSDQACQVHLPDPRIGKHQADLQLDDDGNWWLEVHESVTPTCLNRAVQRARTKLRHADEIEIGDFAIKFYVESDRTPEALRHERMQALSKSRDDNLPLDTIIHKDEPELRIPADLPTAMAQFHFNLATVDSVGAALVPILDFTRRAFHGSKAWIGVRPPEQRDFEWTLAVSESGRPCVRPSYSTLLEPRCMVGGQNLCVPLVPLAGVRSAMAAALLIDGQTLGMLYVETTDANFPYGECDLMALAVVARGAAARLSALLQGAAAQRSATITTEQFIARQTQNAVTISAVPTFEGLSAAAYRYAGETTCSDFYDILATRNRRAAVLIAKIEADLLNMPRYFAELRAAFRAAALYQEAPHTFCRALNWLLCNTDGNRIHLMVAQIDPASGAVDYCIAGRRVHSGRFADDGSAQLIRLVGYPPVGLERAPAYELHQLALEPGQSLLICTDGVKKAVDRDGRPFGISGIEDEVRDGLGDTPSHVLRDFAADLADYVEGGGHPEDVTAVLIRRN